MKNCKIFFCLFIAIYMSKALPAQVVHAGLWILFCTSKQLMALLLSTHKLDKPVSFMKWAILTFQLMLI